MSKHFLAILAVGAGLILGTPSLHADHDRDHGRHHGNKHFDNGNDQGWERRDGYEYRSYGDRDERPPGWGRGRKTGWGNCGLPPGQARKYGCRMYVYQGRPYYYYQDDRGAIIVRRPIIEVQGSVVLH